VIRYLLLCVTSSDLAAAIMGCKCMTAHAGNVSPPISAERNQVVQ